MMDVIEIAEFAIFASPAIVVDGGIKSVGKIPKMKQIAFWLK